MIRVAAVGDIHLGVGDRDSFRPQLSGLEEIADLLLLAGDLTRLGTIDEADVVADELAGLEVPVIAVLGNHDVHSDCGSDITEMLTRSGVRVLEGDAAQVTIDGCRLGVAGTTGFGGGFAGTHGSDFGEQEMKSFMRRSKQMASSLKAALASLDTDYRVALTHYSPVTDTLVGEPPEIYPFLGSYLLAEAIDAENADLAIHGHAHHGSPHGSTHGGVRVRNVARPVIKAPYAVFDLSAHSEAGSEHRTAPSHPEDRP